MPSLPYNHVRLSLYGTILSTQTWSCNLTVKPQAVDVSNSDLSTWLGSLDTALQDWWNNVSGVKVMNQAGTKYIGARAEFYTNGGSKAQSSADHPFTAALAGSGTGYLPTQVSAVCSFSTSTAGKHQRGRIYIPVTSATLNSSAKLPTGHVDNAANRTAALMTAINASSLATLAVAVIVGGNTTAPGNVTVVRCDDEADIQRRRANKLLPTYTKAATV